jgi:diguanylate cyclase (GGDEF)-like protein
VVIRRFAAVVRDACRQSDFAGRVGGDEFAALLPETSMAGAKEAARRIIDACRALEISTPSGCVKVSCSLGVAETIPADHSVEDVLKRADSALYEAKRSGRDAWRWSPA